MGLHPLIVTAWQIGGRVRARCSWCLSVSDFADAQRGTRCACPSCQRPLQLNAFMMVRVPVFEPLILPEPRPADRRISDGDREILAGLSRFLDHQLSVLRRNDSLVLQQLDHELRFEPGVVGERGRDERIVIEPLRPCGWAKVHPALLKLFEHSGDVHSLAFSPDGRYVASGGYDNVVRVWDVETGQAFRPQLGRHDDSVNSVRGFQPGRALRGLRWG